MDWLSTKDVAKRFNLTEARVRQWIAEGLLKAEKLGRDWMIRSSDLRRFKQPKMGRPRKSK